MHARTSSGSKPWAGALLFSLLPILSLTVSSTKLFAQDDPPGRVARIGYLNGGVSLQASGTDEWSEAPLNYPMAGGDRLYTAPGSRAIVQLGGAELRVWQNTDVTLTNIADDYEQIGLAQGALRLRVYEMDPGSQIEVDTPNGAVLVNAPGDYRIEAFPQNGGQNASSILTINSGNAQLTGPGINLPVGAGYSVGLFGIEPVELQYLDVPEYDDLDYWSIDLDRRFENSISARYVSRQMVGWADLDASGTWQAESEFGPVWYPANVPYGWQPYTTGHWAYVQPWGYTWVDDAPWGFAPFHYGRWSRINGRWGWFPGPPAVRPVYSPALVAFVGGGPGGFSLDIHIGGGGGVAAWFPIGVGEPYVPWYRCSPNYARQVNVTNVNVAVIRNTTIVNNYNTYITKTVINNTTINNTTINNRTVNNVTVNNFNYSNRAAVTAVPASAMSSGAPVARQAVHLNPQQQEQLAKAPVSVRPTAPEPAVPHPSLVAAANVSHPAARPTLMTPTGPARAVASTVAPHPVAVNRLPAPKVVPKNAAPPPAAPRPVPQNRPAQNAPMSQPARPAVPAVKPAPAASAPPAREAAPAEQTRPATVTRPAPEEKPVAPAPAAKPAPVTRPAPVPEAKPAPVTRPAPAPEAKPAPVVRQAPAPAAKPAPPAPAKPDATKPAASKPAPPKPQDKPKPKLKPGEKPEPKDEPKQDKPS